MQIFVQDIHIFGFECSSIGKMQTFDCSRCVNVVHIGCWVYVCLLIFRVFVAERLSRHWFWQFSNTFIECHLKCGTIKSCVFDIENNISTAAAAKHFMFMKSFAYFKKTRPERKIIHSYVRSHCSQRQQQQQQQNMCSIYFWDANTLNTKHHCKSFLHR